MLLLSAAILANLIWLNNYITFKDRTSEIFLWLSGVFLGIAIKEMLCIMII